MSDTSMVALTKSINQIGEAFEAFKEANDQRLEALSKGKDSIAAELGQKVDKIEAAITAASKAKDEIEKEQKFQRERLEILESNKSGPGVTAEQKAKNEYKATFVDWLRNKGQSPTHEQKLMEMARKDVTIGSNAGGGFAVPEEISRMVETFERKFSPVRDLVKVVQTGSSDYKELVNILGTSSGWVGESDSRTATNTSQLREVAPTFGELYAYPQASEWSLDDMFFNVENWIAEEVGMEFAKAEGSAVISGNGTSKPTGMINTAPVSTSDDTSPKRAAAAYQYVNSGDNSPAAIDGDSLIDLIYTLNSAYRAGSTFVMNSATLGAVRKLKDTTSQYLWQPSLQAGQPSTLLGFPVAVWEQMPDVGGGNLPVAFGNFRRGYVLADRVGLRITRDNVTNVGFIRFYVRRRVGGIVLNNDAVKWLKCL